MVLNIFLSLKAQTTIPRLLKKGDTVAIVAPASVFYKPELIDKAKDILKDWGLHPVLGTHLLTKHHHFAGTDSQRAEDLQNALNDKTIKAIWCARGGYGSIRILDKMDWTLFKKYPKWLIGYSDITVLHQIINQMSIASLHAMMPFDLKRNPIEQVEESLGCLNQVLTKQPNNYRLKPNKHNLLGDGMGILLGGNLSVLASMIGYQNSIPQKDFILFIEEINEYKYVIDHLLRTLLHAGYFKHCKGVVVGHMKYKKNNPAFGMSTEEIISSVLAPYQIPIIFGFKAGHKAINLPLILGHPLKISVQKDQSVIEYVNKLSFEKFPKDTVAGTTF